jgi:signal transduction histidine kinase
MIEKYPYDSSDNQNYLQAIVRNANRLGKLVDDLLDVTRIESRTMTLVKEITNLEYLINTVVQDLRVNIKNKKKVEDSNNNNHDDQVKNNQKGDIEIITSSNLNQDNNNTGFNVMVDRSKIIQVIYNIIGNSLNSIYRNKKNNEIDSNYVSINISKSMNLENQKSNNDSVPKENKKNTLFD